jgi:hypothetical protein
VADWYWPEANSECLCSLRFHEILDGAFQDLVATRLNALEGWSNPDIGFQAAALELHDEPVWELAIHALVEKGDRAAAQRELRRYRDVMLRELNAEPPSELYDLVESAAVKRRTLRVVGDYAL